MRIFFRKEEIRMANAMQEKDMFEELLSLRMTATQETIEMNGPHSQRFNIADFQPFEKPPEVLTKKKTKSSLPSRRAFSKMSVMFNDDEDYGMENAEQFEKQQDEQSLKTHRIKMHELEKSQLEEEIKRLIKEKDESSNS